MRKFLTYLCSALLICGNASAYFGGHSAYDLYQYASSGDFRTLRSAGSNINASDSNGQTAICYAINNRDYVAYKNLVMLNADEHPACVKNIPEQDYEDFKRGYEMRGGKIATSFSIKGSTVAWTVAGLAAVGAGVAIAAGGGGGGGGGGSSDTPSPEPTPPPTPSCEGYNLNACLPNGICQECIGATRSYFKLTGCKDGYVMNPYNTGCIPNSSIETEYPLLQCDPNGQCASAMAGDIRRYKLLSCNQGYEMDSTGMACVPICDGYTKEDCDFYTQYISEECSRDINYHKCATRTVTDHCDNYKINADECTSCYGNYKLINGICEQKCKGYTQVPCENNTQYTSETCVDDPNYHKCTTRTNKNCASFVTDKDECSACDAEYTLIDGACVTKCEGYTQDNCHENQYISEQCAVDPTYHKCKDRTITDGCMQFAPKEDKCISCLPGYKFNNGKCDQICIGYTNKACPKGTQYISAYCSDDSNFHICTDRTNTEGCADYEIDKDLCTACNSGYDLNAGKCISACPGYTQSPCATLEYKFETCKVDPSFHICKPRNNTNACSDFDPNDDKCTACVDGYTLNSGVCQLICPGYTKEACPINLEYEDKYCTQDHNFHTCTPRKNVIGCMEFNKTSDDCTKCNGTSETPIAGRCECAGYVTEPCDRNTQYISAECATAAGYHVCTERENIDENCKKYDFYADACEVCKDDYKVVDGACVHICDGYQKEACDNETYYTVSDCVDESGKEETLKKYHRCVERTNFDGCTRFSPSSDTCTACDEDHTLNGEGKCDKNSTLCPGYTKTECNKKSQYMPIDTIDGVPPTCQYDDTFHRCLPRVASLNKCVDYDPNYDKCTSCKDDEQLVDGICTKLCPGYQKEECNNKYYYNTGKTCTDDPSYHECKLRENTMYCTEFSPTKDECTDCKDGYEVNSNGQCEQICPGFKQECGNGWHIAKDSSGNPITCSAQHPDYFKCELDPDAAYIPGCKELSADKQNCKTCEDFYYLTGGKCSPWSSEYTDNCSTPQVNQQCCITCGTTGYEVQNCKCVFNEDLVPGSGGGDEGGGSGGGGDTSGCTSSACPSGTHAEKQNCEGDEHRCVADDDSGGGGDTSGCTSTACKSGYYEQKSDCDGDEHKCIKSTYVSDCDTYKKYEDGCEICENGYGVGNNTGSNTPDSSGQCPAQGGDAGCITSTCPSGQHSYTKGCSSGHKCMNNIANCSSYDSDDGLCDDCEDGYDLSSDRKSCTGSSGGGCSGGTCKSSCNRSTEYIDSCSSCGSGQVFCRPRINVSAGCKTYDEHSDVCDECVSTTNYDLISGTCIPKGTKCMSYDECLSLSNKDATSSDAINRKMYIYPQSYADTNSYCSRTGVDTSKCNGYDCYLCLPREKTITNCAAYSASGETCSNCISGYGVGSSNTTPDKNGLCRGNAGYTGTSSSYVVKGHTVSEDKAKGMTVYKALDNKLDNFGDKVNKYNGYKSDIKQKIVLEGEFKDAVDVTGAYNTHNGSQKDGHGAIEIVRDSESDTPIKGAVKGLVGGNNYEASEVIINLDVDDAAQNGKRSFIAGMGKEVGAYTTDKDEISGIDLGSAEYGQHNAELQNAGSVNITSGGTAPVFGILGLRHAGNVANHSENKDLGDFVNAKTGIIDINAPNAAEVYGIRVNNITGKDGTGKTRSVVKNNGVINVAGGSNVYGIAAKNADIFNNGDINVNADGDYAYGIYADNSKAENNGNITVNASGDNVYGIYAVNNSSVKNNGVININGDTSSANTADGKFIKVDKGSYVINANSIISNIALNTDMMGGGDIVMTNGSNITAPEVSGKLTLSSELTTGSNSNTYTLQNMISGSTQNLDIVSQSAMFKASTTAGDATIDGTLTRSSFNELIKNSSLADYLDKNYESGNATKLFDDLKNIQTLSKLKSGIDDFFGQKMLPRMTFEDMSMMREINLDMNKNMFKQEGAFSFGGNVSPYSYDNNVGSVGRYALHGVNHGKNSYALGVSISDVHTYDDNKDNSRSDQSFVMSAPLGHKTRGVEFITTPKIGYAYGEYTRNGYTGNYNGKVYKRMYALMNEVRYPINVGKMSFTPSAEFNMIGFNVKGSEEAHKPYNLRIPSQNHYSVEAGMGLMVEKEFSLYKHHKFKMNGGVAFYHEFANPYELDISMSEMDGTYRLHDEKRHANRVAARFGFDYKLRKDIDVSMSMLSNIDGECRTDAVCDMKYHF